MSGRRSWWGAIPQLPQAAKTQGCLYSKPSSRGRRDNQCPFQCVHLDAPAIRGHHPLGISTRHSCCSERRCRWASMTRSCWDAILGQRQGQWSPSCWLLRPSVLHNWGNHGFSLCARRSVRPTDGQAPRGIATKPSCKWKQRRRWGKGHRCVRNPTRLPTQESDQPTTHQASEQQTARPQSRPSQRHRSTDGLSPCGPSVTPFRQLSAFLGRRPAPTQFGRQL